MEEKSDKEQHYMMYIVSAWDTREDYVGLQDKSRIAIVNSCIGKKIIASDFVILFPRPSFRSEHNAPDIC